MSKLDMLNIEIIRRQEASAALNLATPDLLLAIEQFNKLDEMYKSDEKAARIALEGIYKESRHFTGKQPTVYSFAQTEFYPFFQGQTDAQCNPYFPITKIQDKTFDGLSPLYSSPTKTGAYARDATFSPIESVSRIPAGAALTAFPVLTGEPLPSGWPGAATTIPGFCTGGTPLGATSESVCLLNGGTWTPPGTVADPVWVGVNTAPALLRVALNTWKADILAIQADLYLANTTENTYWQGIVNNINIVLAAVSTDAVFVRATGNSNPAAWGQTQSFTGATETARQALITAANTGVSAHVSTRSTFLTNEANIEEQVFFGVIKLRLHQANGSFAKIKAAKNQLKTNQSLIDDNVAAISSLNLLKVKAS
ncbi:hypothetical protein UFOVP53_225 [uncultured Caudovirales phage]|uniref:Uncharacterized protein n=1 Tax=uncultured Caudovirales phage TaxID=2100421 RepID=A0A6J5KWQ7_9CAUD|nr:hypothetical protein UFOVP53_225 [uncultured Caudovirales phage]